MLTAKEAARDAIERMPDQTSMDDILYRLAVIAGTRRGLVSGGELKRSSPE